MTQQQLRDLMRERVADETMPDLSARAWRAGQRLRRRRRMAAVGGVVATTAVVSGVVALVDSSPRPDRPNPVAPSSGTQTPSLSASPSASTAPDGFLGALPVYYAPTLAEEARLPLMVEGRPPLPEVLDVRGARSTAADAPMDRAVAAVRAGRQAERSVVLVSPEGEYAVVDTSQLSRAGDVNANMHDPESSKMLAPDGRHLAFPQGDHLMLFEVATRSWSRHDMPASADPFEFVFWLDEQSVLVFGADNAARVDVASGVVTPDERPRWPAPPGLGARASYSSFPVVAGDGSAAQSWFSGRRVTGAAVPTGAPEVLVVQADQTVVAAFVDSAPAGPGGERFLGCCPAATWVAPGVPAYLSVGDTMRLIAWRAGTDRFEVVSEVVGWSGAVSFADFSG